MLRCIMLLALLYQGTPPGAGRDVDLPDLDALHVPLPKTVVKGASVAFALSSTPVDPHFQGDLSPDGKSIKGMLTQQRGTCPFVLRWVSKPEREPAVTEYADRKGSPGHLGRRGNRTRRQEAAPPAGALQWTRPPGQGRVQLPRSGRRECAVDLRGAEGGRPALKRAPAAQTK